MRRTGKGRSHSRTVTEYAAILAAAWTLVVGAQVIWDWQREMEDARELVRNEARAILRKDQAFRHWGASHGGVYVPPTDHTPPNPNLSHIPDRDIETTTGKKLTLMNPAYMVRQLMEDYEEQYGIRGRITSLKLLRPENAPDEWERAALESLERGETEVNEFSEIDGEPYVRLMRPLMTKQACLKCHGHQGYKVGDVSGGMAASVPAGPYFAKARADIVLRTTVSGVMWLIGLGGLTLGARRIQQRAHERDRAEGALKEAQLLLKSSVESPKDMIILSIDKDYRYLYFNNTHRAVMVSAYGASVEIGMNILDCISNRDDRDKSRINFGRALGGESHSTIQEYGDLDRYFYETFYNPIVNERNEIVGATAFARNITERKNAEKEREKLIAELEAKNSELERFAYTVSHDLKGPLLTINGFAGLLATHAAEGDQEAVEDDIGRIGGASAKMAELLDSLLELSRIGRIVNPVEMIGMDELVQEAIELTTGRASAKGIVPIIVPGMPTIRGDRPRMLEVVQNLLENAIKYIGDQSQPRVEVGFRQQNGENLFYVSDNGIGIEQRFHKKIFGLFDQLNPGSDGTGIGLALVKRIVENHGGRVFVESDGDYQGSTFYFTIPSQQVHPPKQEVVSNA